MSILWRAAAELGEEDWPVQGRCWCGVELPWSLTRYPAEGQGPATYCDRCAAPLFRIV